MELWPWLAPIVTVLTIARVKDPVMDVSAVSTLKEGVR